MLANRAGRTGGRSGKSTTRARASSISASDRPSPAPTTCAGGARCGPRRALPLLARSPYEPIHSHPRRVPPALLSFLSTKTAGALTGPTYSSSHRLAATPTPRIASFAPAVIPHRDIRRILTHMATFRDPDARVRRASDVGTNALDATGAGGPCAEPIRPSCSLTPFHSVSSRDHELGAAPHALQTVS